MGETERPTLFYLFPDGQDFKIVQMKDVDALKLWEQGKRWGDMPQKTQADAEQLRLRYLTSR